jgi:hypothetical protein
MNQPNWITEELTPYDIAAIDQSGCASGAYMPAVTYSQAIATMGEYGDDVLSYIEDVFGELPDASGLSWGGIACLYLSTAVELFASANSHLADWEDDDSE